MRVRLGVTGPVAWPGAQVCFDLFDAARAVRGCRAAVGRGERGEGCVESGGGAGLRGATVQLDPEPLICDPRGMTRRACAAIRSALALLWHSATTETTQCAALHRTGKREAKKSTQHGGEARTSTTGALVGGVQNTGRASFLSHLCMDWTRNGGRL